MLIKKETIYIALGALAFGFLLSILSATSAPAGWFMPTGHLSLAKKYVGKNPSGWSRAWCGKFVHDILVKSGKPGGGYSAFGYKRYGRPSSCRPGAIAVLSHSHVGFVQSCNAASVTLVSGNNRGSPGRRVVGVSNYHKSRVVAYRMP